MRRTIEKYITGAFVLVLMLFMTSTVITGQENLSTEEIKEQKEEGIKEVSAANKVFREIMSKPDKAVPRELLENATAIGIFPNVVKAAFIVGGRGGDGIVMRRTASGDWGMPVFYNMGGASFGAQIGGSSTDYIMLFMNEGALQDLLDDKLEFGGALSFAAGPVGRTVGAGTNLTLDAGILTWSRSEGAFIGASLKGAVLTADNSVNQAFYGKQANEILGSSGMENLSPIPNEFNSLKNTLIKHGGTSTKNSTATMTDNNNSKNIGSSMNNQSYKNSNMNRYASFDTSEEMQNRSGNNSEMMRSVQDLSRRIRSELLTLPYYSVFDWIEFEVDPNGVVTLNGQVTSPPDTKTTAAAYAEDVTGVTRVINNIEVLPVSPNDQRLRERLYREIYSGPLFRYQVGSLQNIHIIVNNGRATLKGVVDSQADKNLAGIRAKGVSGLFEVTNELAVRGGRGENL